MLEVYILFKGRAMPRLGRVAQVRCSEFKDSSGAQPNNSQW